ncbi:MAG TPA: glycosyltransferase [Sedimentisphaerales bacterium]|nr:glycosyltransferase [Sedimentisphaerales bacterium]
MKKVLMIARSFPPFFPVGFSIRVVKFIKYLPVLGWLPVVLTIDDQKECETTRKVGSETLLSEIQPEVKICRTTAGEPSLKFLEKEREFGQRNYLTAIIVKVVGKTRRWAFRNLLLPDWYVAWLPFALRRGRQIVRSEGIDVIFATCPPHSDALIGAFLKRLTGKPLLLDFRDDWIDTPWYHSKPTIRRMIERRMESWAVKTADKVILVTEWSKNAFLGRYPAEPSDKFAFISNGCDLGDFAVLNSMTTAPRNSRFTIVHAGSLNVSKSWGRSPAGLFQAVNHILQQQPDLTEKLTLVFAGDLPEEHRRMAEEMGLSGVMKGLGHLPHDAVLRLTKSADLLMAINYEGWSTLIPAKIYEYWAVGGPPILLLSCPGAAADFVEQHALGLTAEPSDVDGIRQAILTIYHQSKTSAPLRVSTTGIEAYARQALTRKLAQVLSTVCNQRQ